MKLSIVDGERCEPKKGMSGSCIGCGQQMIAKCGPVRIWHWAHRSSCECDHWWENETEWHRSWKNSFPIEWQEIRQKAQSGEWHIADVRTSQGNIIEFQHSFLKQDERRSRNEFYGNSLVWVVDGLARRNDRSQFERILKDAKQILPTIQLAQLHHRSGEYSILRDWSQCNGLVFFDFGPDLPLWCLLPKSLLGHHYVLPFSRENFVSLHRGLLNGSEYSGLVKYLSDLVRAYENPQQTPQQQIVSRRLPQRHILISPGMDARVLHKYLTRTQQRHARKFRF